MNQQEPLIVGVDGGGTSSKYVAVKYDGTVIAVLEGKGLNYNSIGMETARKRLFTSINALLNKAGASDYEVACVGLSALDGKADEQTLQGFCGAIIPYNKLRLNSDVHAALIGSQAGDPNVMVISGTGSMVAGLDTGGRIHISGGWGYRLNDPASAYGVSIEGLKAALMHAEETGEQTILYKESLDYFRVTNSRSLVAALYVDSLDVVEVAGFGQRVIQCARRGDKVATDIIEKQYTFLAEQTAQVMKQCPKTFSLYGGMFEHNEWIRSYFIIQLQKIIPYAEYVEMKLPPSLGTVIAFLKEQNKLTNDIIERMRKTMETFGNECT